MWPKLVWAGAATCLRCVVLSDVCSAHRLGICGVEQHCRSCVRALVEKLACIAFCMCVAALLTGAALAAAAAARAFCLHHHC